MLIWVEEVGVLSLAFIKEIYLSFCRAWYINWRQFSTWRQIFEIVNEIIYTKHKARHVNIVGVYASFAKLW
jgi:hypothetical protein